MSLDYANINAHARARLPDLAAELFPDGYERRDSGGWRWWAINVTRADTKIGSFYIRLDDGRGYDFATGEGFGDPVGLWAYRYGISNSRAGEQLCDWLGMGNGQAPPPPLPARPRKPPSGWVAHPVNPERVPEPEFRHSDHGLPQSVYRYEDATGRLFGFTCRYASGPKALPRAYCVHTDTGHGAWRWQGLPEPRPLYGVGGLAGHHGPILIVEGEKCADAANAALAAYDKLLTLCWAGGAEAWRKTDWSPLAGRQVILWPDNDASGRRAMAGIAAELSRHECLVRHIVPDPSLPDKWDVADFLEQGASGEDLYAYIRQQIAVKSKPEPIPAELPEKDPRFLGEHDTANAARLLYHYGEHLRYVDGLGWLVWDKLRWARDRAKAVEFAKRMAKRIATEAKKLTDAKAQEARFKWARGSQNLNRIHAALTLAESSESVRLRTDDLDRSPWLLTCKNGTVDLTTGTLREPDPTDLITRQTAAAYHPESQAPRWIQFLNEIFHEDADLIAFFQRAVGYSLTGATSERVLFICWGSGANGKTTAINAIMRVLGDYAEQTPADTLMTKNRGSIPNDLARLPGARFVAAAESEQGQRFAESLVKQLTGGDRITARFLNQEWFTYQPQFKLWLSTNYRPQIRGTDSAIWSRIRLIPFTVSIPEADQDRTLNAQLEAEGDGILAWAVAGARAYQAEGLSPPEAVLQATKSYQIDEDILAAFLEECCVIGVERQVSVKQLRDVYMKWCEKNGERPLGSMRFRDYLSGHGFARQRIHTGAWWQGIGLGFDEV